MLYEDSRIVDKQVSRQIPGDGSESDEWAPSSPGLEPFKSYYLSLQRKQQKQYDLEWGPEARIAAARSWLADRGEDWPSP